MKLLPALLAVVALTACAAPSDPAPATPAGLGHAPPGAAPVQPSPPPQVAPQPVAPPVRRRADRSACVPVYSACSCSWTCVAASDRPPLQTCARACPPVGQEPACDLVGDRCEAASSRP